MDDEKKLWRWDEGENQYVFAGVTVSDAKHDPGGYDDQTHETIENLMNAANENPDATIGHLAAIVYELSLVVSGLRQENIKLRKDLDNHEHTDAVVVQY
jgi:hypothetical protein